MSLCLKEDPNSLTVYNDSCFDRVTMSDTNWDDVMMMSY